MEALYHYLISSEFKAKIENIVEAFQTMKDATRIGERTGVRLPHAIYALAAQATGKDELIRDALRTYGKSVEDNMPVNPKYRLFDPIEGELVYSISDRY